MAAKLRGRKKANAAKQQINGYLSRSPLDRQPVIMVTVNELVHKLVRDSKSYPQFSTR